MQKRTFTDQLGREISVSCPPKRIISLVPSQTELLFDLGLDEEVVGITRFCVHPEGKFKSKTKIGGTKQLNLDKIRGLNPDLIIGNKEENDKGQVEVLMKGFPVWMSDIYNLDDSMKMIAQVGRLIGKEQRAAGLAKEISEKFSAIRPASSTLRIAYFIWKNPYMVAAKNTFIDDMLGHCGWENAFSGLSRYPVVNIKDIQNARPHVILLSSEPYPFKEKHIGEFKEICPGAEILIADGEMFSWYGSRLKQSALYMQTLLNRIETGKL